MTEHIEERMVVSGAITDWSSVTINLAQHHGKYLTRVTVSNATTGTTQERGSVGMFHLRAKARSINTMLQTITLRDLDLFGYYETLDWEGSVLLDEVDDLQAHWVPVTAADVIIIRAVISDVPGSHKSMDKPPRERLLQTFATVSTGAGGTTTATLTVPVGRKWEITAATIRINEAGKAATIVVYTGTSVIKFLLYRASTIADTNYMYPHNYTVSASHVVEAGLQGHTFIKERNTIQYSVAAASAGQTIQYSYTIIETPDTKYPAPT